MKTLIHFGFSYWFCSHKPSLRLFQCKWEWQKNTTSLLPDHRQWQGLGEAPVVLLP